MIGYAREAVVIELLVSFACSRAHCSLARNNNMIRVPAVEPITFKNVLFVTDCSSSSEMALSHAIALAAAYGGRIVIGHVITPQLYELVPPDSQAKYGYARRRTERMIRGPTAFSHYVSLAQRRTAEQFF